MARYKKEDFVLPIAHDFKFASIEDAVLVDLENGDGVPCNVKAFPGWRLAQDANGDIHCFSMQPAYNTVIGRWFPEKSTACTFHVGRCEKLYGIHTTPYKVAKKENLVTSITDRVIRYLALEDVQEGSEVSLNNISRWWAESLIREKVVAKGLRFIRMGRDNEWRHKFKILP